MINRINFGLMSLAIVLSTVSACLAQDLSKANQEEHVFDAFVNDSIAVTIKLRYDAQGLPDHYYCHVNTPVCEEGLCKLMVIDVYWDVLGNFMKYETPPGDPLTKFDHLEFTAADHEKLRAILADRASILRDYPFGDLVDNRMAKKSNVVDAVSAATRVGVRDAVVSGAVYSTYTLWQIVNGTIATRIESCTKPLMGEALLMKMFDTDNVHYQYYALNHYPEEKTTEYVPRIIRLVINGVQYIPYFAIEKLPDAVWQDGRYQLQLLEHFRKSDFELQNGILNKLHDITLSTEALNVLIAAMDELKEKQVIKVLEIARRNQGTLGKSARTTLAGFATHENAEVAQLTKSLLQSMKERK